MDRLRPLVAGVLLLFALLKFPLGLATITIAHVAFCISFVVIVVLARIQGLSIHEVAKQMGDIALIRSMHTSHSNHYNATLGMHTGSFAFDPRSQATVGATGPMITSHFANAFS